MPYELVGQSGDSPQVEVVRGDGHIVRAECGIELGKIAPAYLSESSEQRRFSAFLYSLSEIVHASVFDDLKRQSLFKTFKEVRYRVPGETSSAVTPFGRSHSSFHSGQHVPFTGNGLRWQRISFSIGFGRLPDKYELF